MYILVLMTTMMLNFSQVTEINNIFYHAAHALLLHTVKHRTTNKRNVYRRPVKA